jgi:hypothetical protein
VSKRLVLEFLIVIIRFWEPYKYIGYNILIHGLMHILYYIYVSMLYYTILYYAYYCYGNPIMR